MSKVRHLHSRVTTILEAARLVRRSITDISHIFDIEYVNSQNLQGACGIASYVLKRVLKRVGVLCDFVMGSFVTKSHNSSHCWVEVPGISLIVDVTATQFDIPSDVHVTSDEDVRYRPLWKNASGVNRLKGWGGQSHVVYKHELDTVVENVVVELFQSDFVTR
jgi:hypothetical protein